MSDDLQLSATTTVFLDEIVIILSRSQPQNVIKATINRIRSVSTLKKKKKLKFSIKSNLFQNELMQFA